MKVVITGTSRGIGLEMVHLALMAGHEVMALARQPEKSPGLLKLKNEFKSKLTLVTADLYDENAAATLVAMVKDWGAVDVLVNNAGIMKTGESRSDFQESFLVNSIVPFEITRALMPYLSKSKSPKVIQITSMMGSIADNSSGGYYAYRSSKTALNMITASLVKDHPKVAFAVLHPGWVKTDMGGAQAPTSVSESAQGLWRVIEALTLAKSGHFLDFKGKELPW